MILKHHHLLVRAELDSPPIELLFMKGWIKELVKRLDMTIMSGPHIEYCHLPGNRGLTTVSIIETSHVAAHLWDEVTPALLQLDVYSCSNLDPKIVFNMLEVFDPTKIEYKFLDREHGFKLLDESDTTK